MIDQQGYPLDYERRFGGVRRLYGPQGAEALRKAHVAVIGLGGVGSWAVEALARTTIGELTLIDLDNIAESNTNRQLQALTGAYGKPKVDALKERVEKINPTCKVNLVEDFLDESNAEALISREMLVLDCIDSVKAKAVIAALCRKRGQFLVVSGAAGGKVSPLGMKVDDLARVQGDPILSSLRHVLRKQYGFPKSSTGKRAPEKFGLLAVYNEEQVKRPTEACEMQMSGLSCAGYGSSVVVTASLGFTAASVVINHIAFGQYQK